MNVGFLALFLTSVCTRLSARKLPYSGVTMQMMPQLIVVYTSRIRLHKHVLTYLQDTDITAVLRKHEKHKGVEQAQRRGLIPCGTSATSWTNLTTAQARYYHRALDNCVCA